MADAKKSPDLHGNAPDSASVALLLIDVINDLEFKGGAELKKHALPAAKKIAALKRRAARAGVPTVYVNDNFGKWRSDFNKLVSRLGSPPQVVWLRCGNLTTIEMQSWQATAFPPALQRLQAGEACVEVSYSPKP